MFAQDWHPRCELVPSLHPERNPGQPHTPMSQPADQRATLSVVWCGVVGGEERWITTRARRTVKAFVFSCLLFLLFPCVMARPTNQTLVLCVMRSLTATLGNRNWPYGCQLAIGLFPGDQQVNGTAPPLARGCSSMMAVRMTVMCV